MTMGSFVIGVGAWMREHPDVDAVLHGRRDATARTPACPGVGSRLLRGTSELTRASVTAAIEAVHASQTPPQSVPTVFGSAWGEIGIALDQLEMMVTGDGIVSPFLFKNSVHNTASGVFSIAFGNHGSTTAVAAGATTVAYTLLEGQMILHEGAARVLVVVGDEALPPALRDHGQAPVFAAAFVLAKHPPESGPVVRLSAIELVGAPSGPSPHAAHVPEALAGHPCRPAYELLLAIHGQTPGVIPLGRERGEDPWVRVDVLAQETHASANRGR